MPDPNEDVSNGATAEMVAVPQPEEVPPPARLEENDLLVMSNLNLQLENQNLLLRNLDLQKAQVFAVCADIGRALEAKRIELSKKYGRPIRRDTVAPDGTFITPKKV
jgi:hypothetical protein